MGTNYRVEAIAKSRGLKSTIYCTFLTFIVLCAMIWASAAEAQPYRFTSVSIEGNQRVESNTVLSYTGIKRGETVTGGQLNAAYQNLLGSGLFESVEIVPQGNRLKIVVKEYPTISRINVEGNKRLKDKDILEFLQSKSRRVYSPSIAEADAAQITAAYRQQGRLSATVTPVLIPRSENRVDLVFEVTEGRVVANERIGFVGNRYFSDRRLRRVLETKQAGLFRAFIKSDSFIADRLEFDKQLLADFYISRGFVDFNIPDVTAEAARTRDAYFITFSIQEGQQFKIGEVTTSSDLAEIDPDAYLAILKIKTGQVYSPSGVENSIARLERLALQQDLNFIRATPRITRNDADLTLDIEFVLEKGPRIFVERIDIEGNNTTLDRVVRNEFDTVEGDPFNPRAIRNAAERIRAMGFFSSAEVETREGSAPDQIVLDVDVEEQPTGSLGFGASYSTTSGIGLNANFSETNFLGRGQTLSATIGTVDNARSLTLAFAEPNYLGRELSFAINGGYSEDTADKYQVTNFFFSPSFEFPVSENGRFQVRLGFRYEDISSVDAAASADIIADSGNLWKSSVGYKYSFDSRKTGLNPNAGYLLSFEQDYVGSGSSAQYIRTLAKAQAEQSIMQEEVILRAAFEAGAINVLSGSTKITDRFFLNTAQMRGFEPNSIGPYDTATSDPLGGNFYAAARFEAEFPIGLPAEYGITGGAFLDVGSVWGLDDKSSVPGIDDGLHLRSAAGVSIFWKTAIGPLRFNFSRPISKQSTDKELNFEFTISTAF